VKFPRIYPDEHGETHLGSIELPMHEASVGPPPNPVGLKTETQPVNGWFVFSTPAGTEVPPHNAPKPYLCIVLAGECEVETSDGARLRFGPGDVLFCDDTHGKGHTTRTVADATVVFMDRAGT
jgi:quercetin dioxygenase-like cupin family protein